VRDVHIGRECTSLKVTGLRNHVEGCRVVGLDLCRHLGSPHEVVTRGYAPRQKCIVVAGTELKNSFREKPVDNTLNVILIHDRMMSNV